MIFLNFHVVCVFAVVQLVVNVVAAVVVVVVSVVAVVQLDVVHLVSVVVACTASDARLKSSEKKNFTAAVKRRNEALLLGLKMERGKEGGRFSEIKERWETVGERERVI